MPHLTNGFKSVEHTVVRVKHMGLSLHFNSAGTAVKREISGDYLHGEQRIELTNLQSHTVNINSTESWGIVLLLM